jgi:hypothetical protein
MEKEEILDLPIFPKYNTSLEVNQITFRSAVHCHYDKGNCIEVYLQPVISVYLTRVAKDRQMLLEDHLKQCLVISKYMETTSDTFQILPCVDTLFREDSQFTHKLHTLYP